LVEGSMAQADDQEVRTLYEKVKDKISLEDFQRRIEEKVREHYGLLSEAGAAKLLAREMGVSFEVPRISIRIKDLVPGMQNVDIAGRVVRIYGVRSFDHERGSGKVSNLSIMDETGSVRVVLWGEKAEPVESGAIKRGDVIQIRSGYTRTGLSGDVEVHVGRRGRILVNPAVVEPMPEAKEEKVKIADVKEGMRDLVVEGVVSSVSNVRTFTRPDGRTGKVASLFLRDETGEIRVSLWNENADIVEGLEKGNSVLVSGAYSKGGFGGNVELHCPAGCEITVSQASSGQVPPVQTQYLRLSDLEEGMQNVDLKGKVVANLGRRSFTRLNGKAGQVGSIIIADGETQVRVVLWGDNADALDGMVEGTEIIVENAYTKMGMNQEVEVHVGWRGRIKAVREEFAPLVWDLEPGMRNLQLKVAVVEMGLPEEFEDSKLVSAVVGDATGVVPAVFWDGHVEVVKDLQPGESLLLERVEVNDLGEIHVQADSSLTVLDEKVEFLAGTEPKATWIGSLQEGTLSRIRAATVGLIDVRVTEAFGEKRPVCTCLLDDGTGQAVATIFGSRCSPLFGSESSPPAYQRENFILGKDFVFDGVLVGERFRVRKVSSPDPKEEMRELLKDVSGDE